MQVFTSKRKRRKVSSASAVPTARLAPDIVPDAPEIAAQIIISKAIEPSPLSQRRFSERRAAFVNFSLIFNSISRFYAILDSMVSISQAAASQQADPVHLRIILCQKRNASYNESSPVQNRRAFLFYSTKPYLTLIRSSFSSIGSAAMRMKTAVAAAWIRSMGRPDT